MEKAFSTVINDPSLRWLWLMKWRVRGSPDTISLIPVDIINSTRIVVERGPSPLLSVPLLTTRYTLIIRISNSHFATKAPDKQYYHIEERLRETRENQLLLLLLTAVLVVGDACCNAHSNKYWGSHHSSGS